MTIKEIMDLCNDYKIDHPAHYEKDWLVFGPKKAVGYDDLEYFKYVFNPNRLEVRPGEGSRMYIYMSLG